jgi:hypothetical protein
VLEYFMQRAVFHPCLSSLKFLCFASVDLRLVLFPYSRW